MIPHWLSTLSVAMLLFGAACSLWIIIDILAGHRQHMAIMNIVWPVIALFGTVFTMWGYYKYGRLATHSKVMEAKERGEDPPHKKLTPFPATLTKSSQICRNSGL